MLCQDVNLKLNTVYKFSFIFSIDGAHSSSTLSLFVNFIQIYSVVPNTTVSSVAGYV